MIDKLPKLYCLSETRDLNKANCGMFMVKFVEFLMTKDLDIRHCTQDKMDVF